jgi:hypothetical protein
MMRRRSSFVAASALALGAFAPASEIITNTVDVDILPDGSYRTVTHLEVRMTSVRDVDAWSPYPILLDENRKLEDLTGKATLPNGTTRRLKRSDLDTRDGISASVIADSSSYRLIRIPDLPAGSTLSLDYSLLVRPYYPTGEIQLQSPLAATTRLAVTIRGGDAHFRYSLLGGQDGLVVEASPRGVIVTGANLPAFEIAANGPDRWCTGKRLRFGWGREGSWEDAGRWWVGLSSSSPAPGSGVAAAARELGLPGKPASDVVGAVLAYVHAHVRYVGVELGIGGLKPVDPETTLVRGWGDCKALAVLTSALLRQAGIDAVPAAVAVSGRTVVEPEFPSLDAFDHMVLAVPAEVLGGPGVLDESGARAFLDPTTTAPGLDRLPVHLRGHRLLLLRDAGGLLVTAAAAPELEAEHLRVELVVADDGSALGTVSLELTGVRAAAWLELAKTGRPNELDIEGHRLLSALLPTTAELLKLSWAQKRGPGATVVLGAMVSIRDLLVAGQSSSWFQTGGPVATPAASTFAARSTPLALTAHVSETTWSVRLPVGQRLAPFEASKVVNDIGAFSETLTVQGQVSEIVRRGELRHGWVDVAAFALLREVAVLEHRAQRRRLIVERVTPSGNAATPAPGARAH